MNERRKRGGASNKTIAYIAAGLVHAVIIGAVVFNFTSKPKTVVAHDADKISDVIQATTVDESQIKQAQQEIERKEREKKEKQKAEEERLKKLKQDREKEEQRLEDLKKKQEKEKKEAERLEAERKAIALEKKKAEEAEKKRKEKEQRERREREQKELERKAKEEAERKQRQQELERIEKERQELEARRDLQRRLAEEENRLRAQQARERAATLQSKYIALIEQEVRPKITIQPGIPTNIQTQVRIRLSPTGDVLNVSILKSSGYIAYDKAVETAVYGASPLPIPSREADPEVNKLFQDLAVNFSP